MSDDNYNTIEDMDWNEVADTFKKMKWQWGFIGIPNATQLKAKAYELCKSSLMHDTNYASSGRITIVRQDGELMVFIGHDSYGSDDCINHLKMDSALE